MSTDYDDAPVNGHSLRKLLIERGVIRPRTEALAPIATNMPCLRLDEAGRLAARRHAQARNE